MNPDEETNYQIAWNHQNGNGYSIYSTEQDRYVAKPFMASSPFYIRILIKVGIKKGSGCFLLCHKSNRICVLYNYCLVIYYGGYEIYHFFKAKWSRKTKPLLIFTSIHHSFLVLSLKCVA
jgi:hypothetical protein